MSSIASKVGGSKTTLWTYFPSKEELFAAVVDDIVAQYGDALAIDLPLDEPVPDVLRIFGNLLLTKLTATPILSLFRSEERRVGKECVSTFRSRWSPYH